MEVIDWHREIVGWVEESWVGVLTLVYGTVRDSRSLDYSISLDHLALAWKAHSLVISVQLPSSAQQQRKPQQAPTPHKVR